MIYSIPNETKKLVQTNRSNVFGNIWATKNIDTTSNLGSVRLSPKLVTTMTNADDADLGTPVAFEYFDDRWWAICGTRIFRSSVGTERPTTGMEEDASTGALTNYGVDSDLAVFDGFLWATRGGKLMSKPSNTGDWVNRTGAADLTGDMNKLAYLKKFNRLYFVESDREIGSVDSSSTVSVTGDYYIDLGNPLPYSISTMVTTSDTVWVGTLVPSNGGGDGTSCVILEWDGISSQITKEYPIAAAGIKAMCVDPDTNTPYAMDTNGRVLGFTGYGFKEIGRLPLEKGMLFNATTTLGTYTFIHPNGMTFTPDGTILVLVRNKNDDNDDSANENLPSGIWELDLSTGSFTHKQSFTLKARSRSTITDFGQDRISNVGALKLNYFDASDTSVGRATLLAGATVYSDATNTISGIYVDSPYNADTNYEGQKAGYFVTNWLEAPLESVKETWQRAYASYRKFLGATDKIVIKYRTEESTPVDIAITWVDTTHFTTATDISGYIGYEVEGIQGTGSGGCAHITAVTGPSGGLYTATVDQAFTGVTTGTAKARIQNWTKAGEITGQTEEVSEVPIIRAAPRIQVKVYVLFTSNGEFHKLKLLSQTNQPIK